MYRNFLVGYRSAHNNNRRLKKWEDREEACLVVLPIAELLSGGVMGEGK